MAKALTKPQPTSSVNRFLKDTDFGAALDPLPEIAEESSYEEPIAIVPPRPHPAVVKVVAAHSPVRQPVRTTQRYSTIEVVLTPELNDLVNSLHMILRDNTGASLNKSQLLRSLLRAVKHNLRGVEREAERLGLLKRPSNNPGFEEERELFEETCAQVFLRGMRG